MGLQKQLRRVRDAVFGGTIRPSQVEADETATESLNTESLNIESAGNNIEPEDASGETSVTLITRDIFPDEAESIDATDVRFLYLFGSGPGDNISGIFGTNSDEMNTFGKNGINNEGSTTLGGTTGPEDSLNISRDDDTVFLENRTGVVRNVAVLSFVVTQPDPSGGGGGFF